MRLSNMFEVRRKTDQLGQKHLKSSSPRTAGICESAQSSGHLGKPKDMEYAEAKFLRVELEAIEASSALPQRRRRAGTH